MKLPYTVGLPVSPIPRARVLIDEYDDVMMTMMMMVMMMMMMMRIV